MINAKLDLMRTCKMDAVKWSWSNIHIKDDEQMWLMSVTAD